MNNYFMLVVFPNLSTIFEIITSFVTVAFCLCSVILFISYCENNYSQYSDPDGLKLKEHLKHIKKIGILVATLMIVGAFLPSRKEIIMLKSVSIMQETKGIENIPQNLVDKINEVLKITDQKE